MSDSSMDRRKFLGRSASLVGASSLLGAGSLVGAASLRGEETGRVCYEHSQRATLEARVIARAWRDEGYREALKRNPRAVLSKELRVDIPDDVQVRVVEEDPKTIYFRLPANPNTYLEKQPDNKQLQLLAAGVTVATACTIPSTVMTPAWFGEMNMAPQAGEKGKRPR